MRIHRVLAEASIVLLKSVFRDGKVLDQEVADAFHKNPKWGKRDRGFIAETVYEVARWRRALSFVADSEEISSLCAAQWRRMGYDIPDWWKYRGASISVMENRESYLAKQPRPIRESIPDWLDEFMVKDMGDELWEMELKAMNRKPRVMLRVNSLKCTREEAMVWLAENGVMSKEVPGIPQALILPHGKVLPKPLRFDGRVEIQDAGSQIIVPMMQAKPGEKVIDACSGAGGKTLQLAAEMNNEGKIYAMDINENKLRELKKRARRAGVRCVVPKLITETTASDFAGVADRLLIDAPCSGIGTLRRQPDLKWRLKPASIFRAWKIQEELLLEYSRMLKPGGRLVYATCSILDTENSFAVSEFYGVGDFTLVEERKISPAKDDFDGFYAAALIKDQ